MERNLCIPFFDGRRTGFRKNLLSFLDANKKTQPAYLFSLDVADYFLQRAETGFVGSWSFPDFDVSAFLDLLVAPAYVARKLRQPKYCYPDALMELFFRLFPSSQEYSSALSARLSRIGDALIYYSPSKTGVLRNCTAFEKKVDDIFKVITSGDLAGGNAYMEVSSEILSKLKGQIREAKAKTKLTPEESIAHEFYAMNPRFHQVSNPLAYFIYFLFNGGAGIEKDRWEELNHLEESFFSEEEYVSRQLHMEARKASILLIEVMKRFEELGTEQIEISRVSELLDEMYHISRDRCYPKSYLEAFAIVAREIQKVYPVPKYKYNFQSLKVPEAYYNKLSDPKFLNRVVSLPVPTGKKKMASLFSKGTTEEQVLALMAGDYSSLKNRNLLSLSPNGAVHYFLLHSAIAGGCFKPKALQESKVLIMSDDRPFSYGGFRTTMSKWKVNPTEALKKKKITVEDKMRQDYHNTIDELFR